MSKLDKPLYQDFVNPQLCHKLFTMGLATVTPFCWHRKGNEYTLFSLQFDDDRYYEQAFHNINAIEPQVLINAYQVGDMQNLLPDYMLNRNNNEFELHCSSLFSLDVEKAQRLPDVFAQMVIKGLEQYKIDMTLSIKKLCSI